MTLIKESLKRELCSYFKENTGKRNCAHVMNRYKSPKTFTSVSVPPTSDAKTRTNVTSNVKNMVFNEITFNSTYFSGRGKTYYIAVELPLRDSNLNVSFHSQKLKSG